MSESSAMSMQAAVFRGVGQALQIETLPVPDLQPGELLLKVHHCGVCGSDLHATQAGLFVVPVGTVLGHEFAGEVVHSRAAGWSVGQMATAIPAQLCAPCRQRGLPDCGSGPLLACQHKGMVGLQPEAPGGFGQYLRIPASQALRLPREVGSRHGSAIEPLAVGLHAVQRGPVRVGDRVLVIGAGPVGLAVTAFARLAGARAVVVSERAAGRREAALRFGAVAALDPAALPDPAELGARFAREAGGPPDLVFECVGVPGMIRRAITLVRPGGCVVVVGVCMAEDMFRPMSAVTKEIDLRFAYGYSPADWPLVLDLLQQGRVDPSAMLTDEVSLAEMPAAFEALRRPDRQIKLTLRHLNGH